MDSTLDDPALDTYELRLDLVEGLHAGATLTHRGLDIVIPLTEAEQVQVRELLDLLVIAHQEAFE